jgi:epoxyqueuosine reductase
MGRVPPAVAVAVDDLRRAGLGAGLDAVGVAAAEPFEGTRRHLEERKAAGLHGGMHFTYGNPERSTTPSRALEGARSLVVGARGYAREGVAPGAGPHGRVARYAWHDHYAELRRGLEAVVAALEAAGWRTAVLVDDNRLVDREAAHRAGLGWYGKNANLLLEGRGSWFVLGSVVTDAPLAPASEPVADGCGPCRRCIDACPTGAIVAPGVVDARRCLAWLVQAPGTFPVEHRVALGDRIYGCDDCQEVCPPNRLEVRRRPPPPAGADDEAWVGLLGLLEADDDELLRRHGRWYVPRRQPRHLRRNALVALGNVGAGDDPGVERALGRALDDPDPMLRGHAAWAARRLGRTDLVARHLAEETDADVLAELA